MDTARSKALVKLTAWLQTFNNNHRARNYVSFLSVIIVLWLYFIKEP